MAKENEWQIKKKARKGNTGAYNDRVRMER